MKLLFTDSVTRLWVLVDVRYECGDKVVKEFFSITNESSAAD